MAYLTVNGNDISQYVSALSITNTNVYNSKTNARGNTVVDFINTKRVIEVEIIPLTSAEMVTLLGYLQFNSVLTYREPETGAIGSNVNCIYDSRKTEYYTIQTNNVRYKKMKLKFKEL